ncbi:MAG: S8 family serine peptidase [Fibrobacter sp.]|nr:S8 family serine peptidase [Fibrobacter sp.]
MQAGSKISPELSSFLSSQSSFKVWVFFSDKPGTVSRENLSSRALARRSRTGYVVTSEDFPVNNAYIERVKELGGKLRHVYKWENAASFQIRGSSLELIASLPFVKKIVPVSIYKHKEPRGGFLGKIQQSSGNFYGGAIGQLNLMSIPEAHNFLQSLRASTPGDGVLIALFDSGFRLDHQCFSYLKKKKLLKAARDFIDNDTTVADPDSVKNDRFAPYHRNDEHGSMVLSLISGYDPGRFAGTAWGASIALARTENTFLGSNYETEIHSEEDNWAAAVVWAESLGVDIISSSLGYRDGFQDTAYFETDTGVVPIVDYPYSWLDGSSTIVSRAAAYAAEHGILVVNAAGNEGTKGAGSIVAPADVEDVVSVGAVSSSGEIAYFSGRGPLVDGRKKPDLVVQGMGVEVPVIYGDDLSSYAPNGNGTSFSTPMVAGLCALILQSHPGISSEKARQRLYSFCNPVPFQDSIDNSYGRGIPDALLSCMGDNEVFITVKDSSGDPVRNALIQSNIGDSLAVTDSSGLCFASVEAPFPASLWISLSGQKEQVMVQSAPARKDVVLGVESGLVVLLKDQTGKRVENGTVFYKLKSSAEFQTLNCDSNGVGTLTMYREEPVQLYAVAPGYLRSDTLGTSICAELCTLQIKMQEISASRFLLYPTVLKKKRNASLTIEFMARSENYNNLNIKLSFRSADGDLVWKYGSYVEPETPFRYKIDPGVLRPLAPGLYFFIVEYSGKVYRKKFIISE